MNPRMQHGRLVVALVAAFALAAPALGQARDWKDIRYPQLPEFRIPQPEVYTLENGMTVFLLEDHELPLISATAYVRGGAYHAPAELTGFDSVFGQVLREGGTEKMSGDAMDDFLAARAAQIETGMGGDMATAGMNALAQDFDAVFAVFADVLRRPAFAEDKIDLARKQLETGIARRNDNVDEIVGREFRKLIYGADSPLAAVPEYATVAAIDRDDLVTWHRRQFHPNNVYLGVVGDFDSAQMKQKIRSTLGDWKKGPAAQLPAVAYRKEVKPGVYFVEKSDVTQANIRLGHLGIETNDPDYFAVQVMNEVLGGSFASRLFSNVRSQKGLAYSVFGGVGSSFLRPGVFQTGASTKSETMAQAVDALNEEIRGIIVRPPTDEELSRAKESILNSFIFNYDSRALVLDQQMTYAFFGMPRDFLETYRKNIEKVTKADVTRVAKEYVHPDTLVLLVVGRSDKFDRPASTFGQVVEIDTTIPPPPGAAQPQVERSSVSAEQGKRIVARMGDELAGGELRGAETKSKIALQMGGQSISLDQTLTMQLPDSIRASLRTPMGEQIIVIQGDSGTVLAGGQRQEIPADKVAEEVQALGRDVLVIAAHAADPALEALAAGAETIDGVSCDLVQVSYMGATSRLCVDAEGRVVRQTYSDVHPMRGTPGTMEVRFKDWRSLDGWTVPYREERSFDGDPLATVEVQAMVINPTLGPTTFDLPPE